MLDLIAYILAGAFLALLALSLLACAFTRPATKNHPACRPEEESHNDS